MATGDMTSMRIVVELYTVDGKFGVILKVNEQEMHRTEPRFNTEEEARQSGSDLLDRIFQKLQEASLGVITKVRTSDLDAVRRPPDDEGQQ